jgi:Ser/Thr protein kinase RdoA (MazF antagonist)
MSNKLELPMDPQFEQQSDIVTKTWGLESSDWRQMDFGNALCWRFVADQTPYFLKQMRSEIVGTEERIREILDVQTYFSDQGLPVVRPVATTNGTFYINRPEGYYTLYPFVSHRLIPKNELSDKNITSLAQTLAAMHRAGAKGDMIISKVFKGWKEPHKFNETIARLRDTINERKLAGISTSLDELVLQGLEIKEDIVNGIGRAYEDLGLNSDHLTHGDFHERNIFFDETDRVAAIIDFDTVEMAPRSREIARACDLLCLDKRNLIGLALEKARLFLRTYREEYPVSLEELKKGWRVHLMKTGMSLFGYIEYYYANGKNAEHFIRDEHAQHLKFYWDNLDEIVSSIYH